MGGTAMSRPDLYNLLIVCAAVFAVAAFVWLILLPAIGAFSRPWEKVAAGFLSLYVLAALIAVGSIGALVAVYFLT